MEDIWASHYIIMYLHVRVKEVKPNKDSPGERKILCVCVCVCVCVYRGAREDSRGGLEVFPSVNIRGLIFAKQLFW